MFYTVVIMNHVGEYRTAEEFPTIQKARNYIEKCIKQGFIWTTEITCLPTYGLSSLAIVSEAGHSRQESLVTP